ncbi:MAG: M28 family peptidase [Fimbriiglobus sp.]|nr:M28 family peptidase [Fimbriiglobus sp.]
MRSLLTALIVVFPAIAAETKPPSTEERVKKDIEFLAGKECEGRGLETKGILKAGEYVAEQFKAAGLTPAFKDGYFQPFDVPGPRKLSTPVTLTFKKGGQTLEPKVNAGYAALVSSAAGKAKGELVFAGYGITSEKPAYDDYAGLDVKGKMVVILRRTPQADDPKGLFGANSSVGALADKVQNAINHGAVGVFVVSDTATAGKDDPHLLPDYIRKLDDEVLQVPAGPVMHLKREVVDALLKDSGTTLADWEAGVNKSGKPNSFALTGWQAESEVSLTQRKFPTRNVVGVLEGAGPLKDQTVVIGAHYDHLGYGERGSLAAKDQKDQPHFGADDNASGTTGLIELARRFGAKKDRQGRRLVFVAFSGEEQGLFGSKHYAANPPFPIADTVFMINMDMIGRMTRVDDKNKDGLTVKRDRLVVYGTGTSTGLEKLVDDTLAKGDYKLFKIPGGSGPSDHTSFYRKGVPVLFFFTGTHKEYHRPTDVPETINIPGLLKVVDGVEAFATHFSVVKERPDYLKTKGGSEDPTDPNQGVSFRGPRMGFMPDNYGEEGKGVLVGPVTKGGPGDKGGLKEGDYIVGVDGAPVTNMTTYTMALNKLKPNTEVEITVMRAGKELKLKVTPIK